MTPLTRTLSRLGVATATGATTVAAIAATGWFAGQAAADLHAQQTEPDAPTTDPATVTPSRATAREQASAQRQEAAGRVVLRPRPERTTVTYHYVTGTAVGTGGAVTATPAPQASSPVTPAQSAPAPAPQVAAPPPPVAAPAPAPSSGS